MNIAHIVDDVNNTGKKIVLFDVLKWNLLYYLPLK
jgi:hypothetical protein